MSTTPSRKIVVLSGGTAANSLVDVFNDLIERNNCTLSYIIPISDNGGSSSELIRVFGGPGIGDIRSRLVRLIPPTNTGILNLFNHRLPSSPQAASAEFLTLLDLTSSLYTPIPTPQALLIRSILSHLHLEILKRTRSPSSSFNFQSASIGNLFLTGARLFSGSFESAIYLFAIIGGVDESKTAVLPAIVSNFTHHISAGLEDGTVITGQNAISHPSAPTALPESPNTPVHSINAEDAPHVPSYPPSAPLNTTLLSSNHDSLPSHHHQIEDATLPGSLPTLRPSFLTASKSHEPPLPSPIHRIWYINPYGQEMHPSPNPNAVSAIRASDAVIYSIGSLYTSLAPVLILGGVGEAVETGPRFKVLILNGSLDRETGGYRATDFVKAVVECLHENSSRLSFPASGSPGPKAIWERTPTEIAATVRKYITHLIHIDHATAPVVDRETLGAWGVECVRCYGRMAEDGKMRYDEKGLGQALGVILGKRDGKERGERSRRNTVTD